MIARLLLALLIALPLWAANPCDDRRAQPANADDALAKLDALTLAGCLGGDACPSDVPACKRFDVWFPVKDSPGALAVLTVARNAAAAAGTSDNLRKLVHRIDAWIVVAGTDSIATTEPGLWRYESGAGGLFVDTSDAIRIDDDIERDCATGPAACARTFAEVVEIITDATLVRRVNGVQLTPQREALVKYVTELDQRWEDYFNKAPSQFPWELLVNSAIYRKHERRGFNEPPSWQLIVAHPTVAYEYTSQSDEHFKSALALEAIGYFRNSLGGSLAAVWSDRADAEKLGYGIVLHWQNKVSVGVTRHNGDGTSILVSPNIEKFVTGNVKKVRSALTRVR